MVDSMKKLYEAHEQEFTDYARFLIEENAKYNLTAITDPNEVRIKHFIDSLALGAVMPLDGFSVLDIGSGAGFPGVPLKIAEPGLTLSLLEANGKKVHFLEVLTARLGLKDVEVIQGRAEERVTTRRGTFDIITARAVGATSMLLELGLPYLKEGGIFALYKGDRFREELAEAKGALSTLHASVTSIKEYDLPCDMGHHALILIRKDQPTPRKYPRAFAQIKKKPL